MGNRFLERQGAIGSAGRASEKRVASRLGGSLTPASGAANVKGDLRLIEQRYPVEAKSTVAGSFRVRLEDLYKITKEARLVGNEPAMSITFTDATGRPKRGGEWVLVEERTFQDWVGDAGNNTSKDK